MLFAIFLLVILLQRGIELAITKKNELSMKRQGAIEFGQRHYPFIIAVHALFLVTVSLEVLIGEKQLSHVWPLILSLFLLTQIVRIWVVVSLGSFWNTKILVLPQASVIKRGPYRFLKHPNYLVVTLEFLLIPLMFNAYYSALIFTLLNFVILSVRIPSEERALRRLTEYGSVYIPKKRVLPRLLKRI